MRLRLTLRLQRATNCDLPHSNSLPCHPQASESLQEELESLRTQSKIWKSDKSNEQDKLKQENTLLRSQLQTRCTHRLLAHAQSTRLRVQYLLLPCAKSTVPVFG